MAPSPPDSWVIDAHRLLILARLVDPSVRMYTKDNWFCKVLAALLVALTLGHIKYREWLDNVAVTIGPLQFYPVTWTAALVEQVCVHEGRHTRQCRWLGLWIHPWVGFPLFLLLYFLLPLPIGGALFRVLFERDAMKYELRQGYRTGRYTALQVVSEAEDFAHNVGSWGVYVYPLPLTLVLPWFRSAAQQILDDA